VWRNVTGAAVLTHNSPWTLTLPDGGTVDLGEIFESGDFGIRLLDEAAVAQVDRTILGDLTPTSGVDDLGNPNVDPNSPAPDRWDVLNGSAGNDLIQSGGGTDGVWAQAGDDRIESGAGDDVASGMTGSDLVLGGAGQDVLWGGADNDRVYGDGELALPTAVAQGETDLPTEAKGELEDGGTGVDTVVGGAGNDALTGGAGADVLVAGAGDDLLLGDHTVSTAALDWSVARSVAGNQYVYEFTGAVVTSDSDPGDDSLYGGAGADWLFGGPGADLLDAGSGDDVLFGEGDDDTLAGGEGADLLVAGAGDDFATGDLGDDRLEGGVGNDYLEGGDGEDQLFGETDDIASAEHGDDVLDGGADDDYLVGYGGHDALWGGGGNDQLFGDADTVAVEHQGNDYLDGEAGNDTLRGYGGNDVLVGGIGLDTLFGDEGDDELDGGDEDDDLYGGAGNDTLQDSAGANTLVGGAGSDWLYGGIDSDQLHGDASDVLEPDQGDDYLDGGAGDDYLWGFGGNDQLFGGDGIDQLAGDAGDDYLDGEAGADTIVGGAGVDELYGGDDADQLFGEAGDDVLDGGAGGNILVGGAGHDVLYGGDDAEQLDADGTDVPMIDQGDDFVDGGGGDDTIWGHGGTDVLYGGDGADSIVAGDGNDFVDGGTGADTLWGNAGGDTFVVDDVGDLVIEGVGEGTDTVESTVSYVLPDHVENLVLTTVDSVNATGNALDNTLTGTVGANILDGGGGNDTLIGDVGDDVYAFAIGAGQDVIQESGPVTDQNAIVLGPGIGAGQVDVTRDGDDALLTVAGTSDQLRVEGWFTDRRGLVDSVRFSDMTQLSLREIFNEAPTVAAPILDQPATEDSPFAFTVPAETFTDDAWDTATLTATLADDSALPAWLSFDSGTRTFTGTPTNDVGTLSVKVTATDAYGASVADTVDISIANTNDAPVVANPIADQPAQEGTAFLFTVPANAFADVDAGDTLTYAATLTDGTALPAWLAFESETRTFSGTPPAGWAGTPLTVRVTASDLLGASATDDFGVEIAGVFTGTEGSDSLVGTTGADVLYGLGGDDRLDGGPGPDAMYGGGGDDVYVVDEVGDTITENPGEGSDTVESAASYTLGGDVEHLTLTGTGNISGTGNALANVLTGNAGTNRLDGGLGADTMIGGLGDDTYVVDDPGDTAAENAAEGTDTVESSATLALGVDIEHLILTGTGSINGLGNELGNTLTGNVGDNRLDGGLGADTLLGGVGNDTYVVDQAGDVVTELYNQGTDTAESSMSYALTANVENLTLTGSEDIDGTGNALNNVITGNAGDNRLDGGSGWDTLVGGDGDDTYVMRSAGWGANIIEEANGGIDTVETAYDFTLEINVPVERLVLTGANPVSLQGNNFDNVLIGNDAANDLSDGYGDDRLDGRGGPDYMAGGSRNDTYVVDNPGDVVMEYYSSDGTDTVEASISYTLPLYVENLVLTGEDALAATGNAANNVLIGNDAGNIMNGGAGNDRLDGGGGADTMSGGIGDDTYVVEDVSDVVTENVDEGWADAVESMISYTLPDNVEYLTLTGSADLTGTGNALSNVLRGNAGINHLYGGLGDDEYWLDDPRDVVVENHDEGWDTVRTSVSYTLPDHVEWLYLVGSADIVGVGNMLDNALDGNTGRNTLSGGLGNDILWGDAGNDVLDGGSGDDQMEGAQDDDTYVVDSAGDVVIEFSGEGIDTVQSFITYTLGANVENLTLIGTSPINGTGNSGGNVLTGNNAANTLSGGLGNDSYYVTAGDTVTELSGQGTNTVYSDVTWTLGANIERLTLLGMGNLNATGNTLANVLTGNAGNNTLDGGSGSDTMLGGAGDDTYVVAQTGDVVTENADEGTDLVQSGVTYTLGANVENLTLTGSSALSGTGNGLNNTLTGNIGNNILTGNAGDDWLDGGSGSDTMRGGTGNDTYVVAQTGDVVTENAGEGIDTVRAGIAYTLGSNVENLTLTGTNAISGTGNALNNVLVGNGGTNTLTGLAGDDTYVIGAGDTVVEAAGGGTDTVESGLSYTLGSNVENLTLTGASAINATGNGLNNVLIGNGGNNTITGAAGHDTLTGGQGADLLAGGVGNDTYRFDWGYGQDTVQENDSTPGNTDTVLFAAAIDPLDLVLSQQGNDLRILLHGSSDQLTIQGWYSGTAAQAEILRAGTGEQLLNAQVDQLIQAMAAFSAQTGLTWDQAIDQRPEDVETILAASWQ
jgi:Ca2+-binding RTX toxin-like protein